MDIELVRLDVAQGTRPLRITTHAQVEAFKEGIGLADLQHVFELGTLIEIREADRRFLLYGQAEGAALPVHVVVEDADDEVAIITAYVPDSSQWIDGTRRRRRQP